MQTTQAVDVMTSLKQGTAAEHRALEHSLPLMSPELSVETYVKVLQVFESFVSQWEQMGAALCPPQAKELFNSRRRAPLLLEDLRFFNASPMEQRPELPFLTSTAAFWGSMYVMEGSTLGGQFISRHLETALGLHDGQGYLYYRGRGAETGGLWKEFCERLRAESESLPVEEITSSARDTFATFHRWIDASL